MEPSEAALEGHEIRLLLLLQGGAAAGAAAAGVVVVVVVRSISLIRNGCSFPRL